MATNLSLRDALDQRQTPVFLKNRERYAPRLGLGDGCPKVSIVVLNFNGAHWLPKCLDSIKAQSIAGQIETILVDNCSTDDSVRVARTLLSDFPDGCLIQNPENLGFCEGNNVGARAARGRYLLFLNNDTWLEKDCIELLLTNTELAGAVAATPCVLNYSDNSYQDFGFFGFDFFGLPSSSFPVTTTREIFIPGGCSYLIRTDIFRDVGMFDPNFVIYAEDADLSWRVWIAGYKIAGVFAAKVHHRAAAGVNPSGGVHVVEFRTNERKRFLTNRNSLLTLLVNGQHLLLLIVLPLTLLLLVESLLGCALLKRWSFLGASFWRPCLDCWRLRRHIARRRREVAKIRRRSDWWMLRFFRGRFNRWGEIVRIYQFGIPRVDKI
jgi:GT2 family glycosyltransferase